MSSTLLSRTKEHLFSSLEEMQAAGLTAAQRERLLRLRDIYQYWLENPLAPDSAVVSLFRERYGRGLTQTYEDIKVVRSLLGAIQQTTKDFLRWKFLQHLEEGFALAREQEDANAYARLLAVFAKGSNLDKEDVSRADYSQIVPQTFEITDNPEAVGMRRIPNLEEKVSAMLKKYAVEVETVND